MKAFAGRFMNNSISNRDFSLDLLRAFSCLMVVGVHIGQRFIIPGALGRFFEKGATGVSFFFILSGYLGYMSMERVFGKEGVYFAGVMKFWIKRALHVLPLYYLVMIVYFVFFTLIKGVPQDETGLYWIRYIFMINTWIPSENIFWNNLGAVWSISAFMLFYLLAPLFYLVIKKYVVAWVAVIAFYGVFKVTDNVGTGRIPVRYMFYFLLGILVYLAVKEKKELGLAAILGFVILFSFLAGGGTALISPFLASLYIIACRGKNSTLPSNGIAVAAVTFISTISYSIYLVHAMVIEVLDALQIGYSIAYLIVFVLATIVISLLSYEFVENRLAKWLSARIFDRLHI